MLRELGHVESVHDGVAWVVCASKADCQRCREGRGCGGGLLGRLLGDRLHRIQAATAGHDVTAGDRVELGLPESALLKGAMQVYALPLAGFFLLPVLLRWLGGIQSDGALLLAGAAGLLGGILVGRQLAKRAAGHASYQPVVTKRLAGGCGDPRR